MSLAFVGRPGQINLAGDQVALFLKIFGGEVLGTFKRMNKFRDLTLVKSIPAGKDATFPAYGKAVANFYAVGDNIFDDAAGLDYPTKFAHNEAIISVDNPLISNVLVSQIDELMNYYDVRAPYAEELVRAIKTQDDVFCAITGFRSARAAAPLTGGQRGTVLFDAGLGGTTLTVTILEKALRVASQLMDQNDVPREDRFCALPPSHYHQLLSTSNVVSTTLGMQSVGPRSANSDFGGRGSIVDAMVARLYGFELFMTNNLPNTNITVNPTGARNTYTGDFSNSVGLCFHRSAIGTVDRLGLDMEAGWERAIQSYAIIAKLVSGHGPLKGWGAIELNKEATALLGTGNEVALNTFPA